MIQRIQTLYLLLAGAFLMLMHAIPFGVLTGGETASGIMLADHQELVWVHALIALVAIISIFLFKNRRLQIRLIRLASIALVLFLASLFLIIYQHRQALPEGQGLELGLGAVLPVVSMLMLMLAARAVRKDERLVASSERLRG